MILLRTVISLYENSSLNLRENIQKTNKDQLLGSHP